MTTETVELPPQEAPLTIREIFDLMADAHMGVFGMKNSPAREFVWSAMEGALRRNIDRQ